MGEKITLMDALRRSLKGPNRIVKIRGRVRVEVFLRDCPRLTISDDHDGRISLDAQEAAILLRVLRQLETEGLLED